MNFIENVLFALSGKMETPTAFGWFHLMFIAVAIGASVLLILAFKDADEKIVQRILMIDWVLLVVLEIYKQLLYSVSFDPVEWDYQWYAFPYQFCDTPMYLLPIAAFAPHEKVRNAARTFIATFSLFAGLAVFVYPGDVFTTLIGINIHTMFHHGSQIVLGVFLGAYQLHRGKMTTRYFSFSCIVFTVMSGIALILDLIIPHFIGEETFNMYFISPHYPCTLPVLSTVYEKVPYPLFLLVYLLGFCVLASVVFGFFKLFTLKRTPHSSRRKPLKTAA